MDHTPEDLSSSRSYRSPPPLRFGLRSIFAMTFVVAVVFALLATFYRSWQQSWSPKSVVVYDQWPRALQELLPDAKGLPENVRILEFPSFVDHKSLWCIKGPSSLIDNLLEQHTLEPTSQIHPCAQELISSMPSEWPKLKPESCFWSTTPGYGLVHMEGPDLFLVVHDEDSDVTIVLHEWIF